VLHSYEKRANLQATSVAEGVKVDLLQVVECEVQPLQVGHVAKRIPCNVSQLVVAHDQVSERSFDRLEETATNLVIPKRKCQKKAACKVVLHNPTSVILL
jgi:hypothetical protein